MVLAESAVSATLLVAPVEVMLSVSTLLMVTAEATALFRVRLAESAEPETALALKPKTVAVES